AGRAALHAAGGRARALRAYSCRSPARAVCVVCFPPPPPSSRAVPRSPPVPLPRADKTRTGFISPTRSLRKSGPSDQSARRAAGARASPRHLIPFERRIDRASRMFGVRLYGKARCLHSKYKPAPRLWLTALEDLQTLCRCLQKTSENDAFAQLPFTATSVQKVLDIFWIPSLGPEPEVESVVPGCAHFPDNVLLDGFLEELPQWTF
ncbi:unnamed protein product, partial [Rangifer tarandus platyrhynchus]